MQCAKPALVQLTHVCMSITIQMTQRNDKQIAKQTSVHCGISLYNVDCKCKQEVKVI